MIDTLVVVHGPASSGKTLNQAAVCRHFKIGTVIHGDPLSGNVQSLTGNALIEVTTTAAVFAPPEAWFTVAKTIKVFSVHQIELGLGPAWIEPENLPAVPAPLDSLQYWMDPSTRVLMNTGTGGAAATGVSPARKPYVSPIVERRLGFDPAACSPEQWAALVWCVHNAEDWAHLDSEEVLESLRELVTVTPTRISADEPRTGDCLELAAAPGSEGRRFFFSNADPKRTIGDPVAWRTLCKTPGATVHLGGLPA